MPLVAEGTGFAPCAALCQGNFLLTPFLGGCSQPLTPGMPGVRWATGRKVWQGTVTPSRRLTPGSIPGSPTILTPEKNLIFSCKIMSLYFSALQGIQAVESAGIVSVTGQFADNLLNASWGGFRVIS